MKKFYSYGLLLAGMIFIAAGCGEQKQPKAANKAQVRPEPRRITLADALKQKFGVTEGWDVNKKRFIKIVVTGCPSNQGAGYSVTLLNEGQIARPEFRQELQGAILALGELAEFIQTEQKQENDAVVSRSSVVFGKLKVNVEEKFCKNPDSLTTKIEVRRDKERLFYLDDAGLQHKLQAEDINLFKSLMASNGLDVTLLGWSREEGAIRMAFSISMLTTWKEKMKTASEAKLEYTKKEVRSKVKKGMKKLSRKLDEWSEEEDK